MKIVLQTLSAGPCGVAQPGTVLDLPSEQAEQMITSRMARPYDRERDAKSPVGYRTPPPTENRR